MKKLLVCLLTLMLLFSAAALAEVQVESTVLENMIFFSRETGCYYARVEGGYQVFDADGNALSAVYKGLSAKANGVYYEYYNSTKSLNYFGLLDARGQVISQPVYGQCYTYDRGWALAYVLEAISGDSGDFKDSNNNWYNAVRTDVYCDGRFLGTLTRDEYLPTYTEGVVGNYFYVKQTSDSGFYLDKDFNRYTVEKGSFYSQEYTYDYKTKSVTHNPTQKKAFCADCTLTPDDVECPVWYDDNTDSLLDLQGNVIKSGLFFDTVMQKQDYLRVKRNNLEGIMDKQGNVIVEPVYDDIAMTYGMFPMGYQAALTPEGHLHYLDLQGNVVAKAEYELSYSDYKGYDVNSIFACVKNMGKVMVITATNGELPTKYEDYRAPKTYSIVLWVKKDGMWGAIDSAGNTVIPFIHRDTCEMSNDGTLVYTQTDARDYMLYRLTVVEEKQWTETVYSGGEDTEPVLAEGAWQCSCGSINTGKFCPQCGSAMPTPAPTATPAPADDGSWTCSCGAVNTSKFCPECGGAKPEKVEAVCNGCGYKPAEGETPKFCPECGTKF
ncbi:MAG: zinc ribbon domain-containing protein [Clostridia bacterium]|nr:zinc ribbon domain-containing protein [Clostridia bacterium]